jgi:hypothetical protein
VVVVGWSVGFLVEGRACVPTHAPKAAHEWGTRCWWFGEGKQVPCGNDRKKGNEQKQPQPQKQIPPLRCGMTKKGLRNDKKGLRNDKKSADEKWGMWLG